MALQLRSPRRMSEEPRQREEESEVSYDGLDSDTTDGKIVGQDNKYVLIRHSNRLEVGKVGSSVIPPDLDPKYNGTLIPESDFIDLSIRAEEGIENFQEGLSYVQKSEVFGSRRIVWRLEFREEDDVVCYQINESNQRKLSSKLQVKSLSDLRLDPNARPSCVQPVSTQEVSYPGLITQNMTTPTQSTFVEVKNLATSKSNDLRERIRSPEAGNTSDQIKIERHTSSASVLPSRHTGLLGTEDAKGGKLHLIATRGELTEDTQCIVKGGVHGFRVLRYCEIKKYAAKLSCEIDTSAADPSFHKQDEDALEVIKKRGGFSNISHDVITTLTIPNGNGFHNTVIIKLNEGWIEELSEVRKGRTSPLRLRLSKYATNAVRTDRAEEKVQKDTKAGRDYLEYREEKKKNPNTRARTRELSATPDIGSDLAVLTEKIANLETIIRSLRTEFGGKAML